MTTDANGNPSWSSWRDPAFNDALKAVDENLAAQFVWDDLRPFYRLQGAYAVSGRRSNATPPCVTASGVTKKC
jgi:hypothetical protein